MVINHPFRISDCTEQELSRPKTERLIFCIASRMEQWLRWSKAPGLTLRQVIDPPPLSLNGAVQQARWLAELGTALDEASKLTVMLCDYCSGGCEASALRAQINALGVEVEAIQRR